MATNCKIISDNNFNHEVLANHQPVLVLFAADGCDLCHIVDPIINRSAKKYRGQIKFCRIDCDANPTTKNTYRIHQLPTLLFFYDGQVEHRIFGAVSQCEIEKRLSRFRPCNWADEYTA